MAGLIRRNYYLTRISFLILSSAVILTLLGVAMIGLSMKVGNLNRYGYPFEQYADLFRLALRFSMPITLFLCLIEVHLVIVSERRKEVEMLYSLPLKTRTIVTANFVSFIVLFALLLALVLGIYVILFELFELSLGWGELRVLFLTALIVWFAVCLVVPLNTLFGKYSFYILCAVLFIVVTIVANAKGGIDLESIKTKLETDRILKLSPLLWLAMTSCSYAVTVLFEGRRRYQC